MLKRMWFYKFVKLIENLLEIYHVWVGMFAHLNQGHSTQRIIHIDLNSKLISDLMPLCTIYKTIAL